MKENTHLIRDPDHYDYIILGTGCAGLSLAIQLIAAGLDKGKKILLVDKEEKIRNDRTWYFCEKDQSLFEPIVCKLWEKLKFYGNGKVFSFSTSPYLFKMIRSDDFYSFAKHEIAKSGSFQWEYGTTHEIKTDEDSARLTVNGRIFSADYLFSNVLTEKPQIQKRHHHLLQHFKHYTIKTDYDVFTPQESIFRDFRLPQNNTSYMSVWPLTKREAFVEYTVLSESPLRDKDYNDALKYYFLNNFKLTDYKVYNEGFGTIPRTNYTFPAQYRKIIFIGAAGGYMQQSTGYHFPYVQKHIQAIIHAIQKTGAPYPIYPGEYKRFRFYDHLILHCLLDDRVSGEKLFTRLFTENKLKDIYRFFDLQTTVSEDFKILWSLRGVGLFKALQKSVCTFQKQKS